MEKIFITIDGVREEIKNVACPCGLAIDNAQQMAWHTQQGHMVNYQVK
jgi:hypothetical protein